MTHHISPRWTFVLAVLVAPITSAQTLCAKGEVDFFSCRFADRRIISVCGIVHDEPMARDWLQYRVGFPRRLERAWPQDRGGSLAKFEGNVFGRYSVSDLRFRIDDANYGITLSRGGEDDGAGGRTRSEADLQVARAGHPDVVQKCVRAEFARYGQSFEALNARLSNRRNVTGSQ